MAAKIVKDLAVKTGSYTKDGETKNRYENVGAMWKSDDGSYFLTLKRTFNPAGVPDDTDRDRVLVSVFDLRDQPQAAAVTRAVQPQQNTDEDIPF